MDQTLLSQKVFWRIPGRTVDGHVAFLEPVVEFFIEVDEAIEGLGVKKYSDIPDQPLHASFFIAGVRVARMDREAIEPCEVQELRIILNLRRAL